MSERIIAKGAPVLPSTPWKFVTYFLKYIWVSLAFMVVFEIGQKFCTVYIAYAFKDILDGAVDFTGPKEQLMTALKTPIYIFIGVSLGTLLFARASGALLIYAGPKLRKITRNNIYHYLQHHSHKYFTSNFSGSLANRINEVGMSVNHSMWTVLFDFLPVTVSFSLSIYLLYTAHLQLALYLAGWVFLYVLVSFFLARKCQGYARRFAAMRSKTTGHVVDAVTNIMNTKMFAAMGFERQRLDKQLTSEVSIARETIWFMEKMRWFQFTAALVLQVGLIIFALNLFGAGQLTVGNFAMVASLGLLIINDARGLSRRFLEFFEYFGNISDGVRILVGSHEIVDKSDAPSLKVNNGELVFEEVSFRYHEKAPVFDNLNVKIKAGEKVGLVGFSGSGKSTFVNLVLRMFDVNSGRILIDGQSISDCTQDSLRSQVSMIPQDPMLFHRSLMDNIRYGKLDADDEKVIEAARKANAHDFIQDVPDKYDALVGERGIKLSGGQRQRIAIARALLKNAPILILDEATSSLDSVTEKTIQQALDKEMQEKTVVVVAHRLSTIAHLDRILVFSEGRIIEDGSHDQLIAKGGHYSLLWSMQAGGFLPQNQKETAPSAHH